MIFSNKSTYAWEPFPIFFMNRIVSRRGFLITHTYLAHISKASRSGSLWKMSLIYFRLMHDAIWLEGGLA